LNLERSSFFKSFLNQKIVYKQVKLCENIHKETMSSLVQLGAQIIFSHPCENNRKLLGKIVYVNNNSNTFKIEGNRHLDFNFDTVIKTTEGHSKGECHCCGKLGPNYMCHNEVEKLLRYDMNTREILVKWLGFPINSSIWLDEDYLKTEVPDKYSEFMTLVLNQAQEGKFYHIEGNLFDPQNGFTFNHRHHTEFTDKRLIQSRSHLRENLWTREEEPTMNTHMTLDGKWLPKAKFADRRLKWANRGKRYNIHPHLRLNPKKKLEDWGWL